ncbi:MAG: MaoC family dehydratase N-terminal domain-containing protein [Bdellovibrionota bacterium]
MTTQLDPTDPIAIFEASVPFAQAKLFFEATDWSQDFRPLAPPTLATIFRNGEFEALKKLNIPLQKVLHGEQKYKFIKELRPDQTYRGETFVASQIEKSGGSGKMSIYVFQTNLIDQDSEVCVECSSTIIVKG